MSLDAIASVGWTSADPMDRYKMRSNPVDLSQFDPSAKGAHLSTAVPIDPVEGRSGVDVRNLYSTFQDGMKHGFTTGDNERLMKKLQEIQKPGSTVTPGEMMGDLVVASSKVAIAGMIGSLTNKVAEGLQTIVVKQS